MRTPKFQQAKSEVIQFFDKHPKSIFSYRDMSNILSQGQRYWHLPSTYNVRKFIENALNEINLKEETITFPYRSYKRYIWKNVSKYKLYLSLVKDSYFSHQTALFLHQLIDVKPSIIFLNSEQSKKPKLKGKLSQEGITLAFENRQRTTNNIAKFKDDTIFLLNGKYTNKTGIIKLKSVHGDLETTNLERTLIDIVVRPDYADSPKQILLAYKKAKNNLSVGKILKTLKRLSFIYPYHQAIGFLLEKSGLNDPDILKPFKKLGLDFDFYLARQMKNPDYSKEWRLYYPKDLI